MKKLFYFTSVCLTFSFLTFSQVPVPPASGSNPYEYIGNSHNLILKSFFEEYTKERVRNEEFSLKDLDKYVIEKSGIKETSLAADILNQPVFLTCRNTTFANLPDQLGQMNAISVKCGNYLRSIDAAIESELEVGFESLNNSTINLENEILADKELSETERAVLLSTASTVRYSAYFWKSFSENADVKSKGTNSTDKLPGWLKTILKADASGATNGAIGGAMAGGLAGVGVGALAGGATGSVANAIEQFFDWLF